MQIVEIKSSATGIDHRDCELISINGRADLELLVNKDSDNKRWRIVFNDIIAYKVISEEFSVIGVLENLPVDGGFYEVIDSPWIAEYGDFEKDIFQERHHYIYCCYDEAIEVIAKDFTVTEVKDEVIQESHPSAPSA